MRHTLTACALLACTTFALAQPATDTQPTPSTPARAGPKQVALAAGFLGQRVLINRSQTPVAPLLVLVPDEGSYLAALKLWGNGARFPILIDDTSLPARTDIARFARAFKPESVVRFHTDPIAPLPTAPAERRAAILSALYSVWKADSAESYAKALASRPLPANATLIAKGPLGIVATTDADTAWPAALALAAAHGQFLTFPSVSLPPAGGGGGTLSIADADRLSAALTASLTEAHLPYAALGDQIDAVTLCLNIPMQVTVGNADAPRADVPILNAKPGEALALTDFIGRSTSGNRLDRWAWCSQIVGSQRQSAYRAMCALFLSPKEAFLFDGYDATPSWAAFDCTAAAKTLRESGIPSLVVDTPHNAVDDWRLATAGAFATDQRRGKDSGLPPAPTNGGLRAGLIAVNTMGNHDFFQFASNTKCRAGDVPILQVPSVVHFVHSWSLQLGADPWAVGGRWLDHGAYAYVGSVHEPYLSAFVPTPAFAARLVDHIPLAAAARVADGPFTAPWRINILGDALLNIGPSAPLTKLPAIPGATPLSAELPELLKARRYEQALDTLLMLNRGADAARLSASVIADDPDHVTSEAALRGVLAAFDAGDFDTLAKMGAKIELPGDRDYLIADAIWQALWPSLQSLNADQARLLSRTLRPYNFASDSLNAALALARADSPAAARAFYDSAKSKAPRPDIRKDMLDNERQIPR